MPDPVTRSEFDRLDEDFREFRRDVRLDMKSAHDERKEVKEKLGEFGEAFRELTTSLRLRYDPAAARVDEHGAILSDHGTRIGDAESGLAQIKQAASDGARKGAEISKARLAAFVAVLVALMQFVIPEIIDKLGG